MRFVRCARAALVTIAFVAASAAALVGPAAARPLPTVVSVHGAFADTTGRDPVAAELRGRGDTVVVPDSPLRGPGYDGATTEKALAGIGP